ncbi:MAG TPA: glycosyltransferase family 4 protein [Gemmatimonadaceae bacterium]|nr:glycosyltransferase family 4 protein [Gemmatimonadaceae bacterium]
MTRRRIAYLLSQYPTYNHTFLLREVRALRDIGVDVEVASLTDPDRGMDALPAIEREEAAQTAYIKRKGLTAGGLSVLGWLFRSPQRLVSVTKSAVTLAGWNPRRLAAHLAYLGQAALVADWLRSSGHRSLHCHFSSTVAMLAAHLADVPWSVTIHGPAEFDDVVAFGLVPKVASAWKVVVISGFARSQVLRHVPPAHWDRVVVVPLGIDPADYSPAPERPAGPRVELLTVGRLASVKAQGLLIDAVRLLHDEGRRLRLRIVGTGPDQARLETQIARHALQGVVELVGPLPAESVTRLYAEVDIFALPSFAEGVPVVLMEAMAMELPCVSSRLMGIPELITDGEDGLLVTPADVSDVARALRHLIDDRQLRRRMGLAARERVLRAYNLRVNVERLADQLLPS